MTRIREFLFCIKADAHRYEIRKLRSLIRHLLFHSGYIALLLFRIQDFFSKTDKSFLGRAICILNFRISGCEFIPGCKIGPGAFLPHASGIIVGRHVNIGGGCTIMQNVTIGQNLFTSGLLTAHSPRIGNNVKIGAGSVILGDISIGDGCTIGALSLVVNSFPPNTLILGTKASGQDSGARDS